MTSLAIEPRQTNATDLEAERRARRRFRGALFWSGLGHAAVIALLLALWQLPQDEPVPIPPIPVTVVPDQEGRSGAAGGGNGDTAASSASSESEHASTATPSQTAPAEAQQKQPQTAEAQPTPPQLTAPQTPAPPAPADALRLSPAPNATEPPQPVQPPEPVPPRKPTPPQPKPTPTVAPTPPTPPTPQPSAPQAAQAPAAATTAPSGAVQGADTPLPAGVGGQGRGAVGAGRAEVGNGSANGTADDYLSKVRLWILRFAKTPTDDCSRAHGDGKIDVTFKRDGTVLDVKLTESSGCPASDAEALRMVHAASPLPPIPDKFPGEPKTIGLPFDFRPGLFDRLFHAH